MKVVIDANRYVDFCKGDGHAVDVVQKAERLFLPFIVVAELRSGFRCGNRGKENERSLIRFLNSDRVSVLYADDQTTHHYANLFYQLRAQGTPLPTNDLWIAALVVQYNFILFSRDKHFDHLPQIPKVPLIVE